MKFNYHVIDKNSDVVVAGFSIGNDARIFVQNTPRYYDEGLRIIDVRTGEILES